MATDGTTRHRPRRLFLLTGAAVACCSLLLGAWLYRVWRSSDDLGDHFPPGALDDYLPEDSAALLAVDLRHMLETPIGQRHLRPILEQLAVHRERLPWLDLTGIKPLEEFDTLLISFASNGGEPLLLARGRPDYSRFQIGADKLRLKPIGGFRVWEYNDRSTKQTTLLAAVGDTLVVSKAQSRVQAALQQASDPRPIHISDETMRQLLLKVDRRQSIWLAASIKRLGPISEIDNYLLRMILRPLLAHADSVYGGITCADQLLAELHFATATEEDASQLEANIKSICEAASGFAVLGNKGELVPLLRLLSTGQIQREGRTILLRCQIAADQLEK